MLVCLLLHVRKQALAYVQHMKCCNDPKMGRALSSPENPQHHF